MCIPIEFGILYHKEPLSLIQELRKGRRVTLINPKSTLHGNPATIRLTKDNLAVRIVATKTHPFAIHVGLQKHIFRIQLRRKPIILKRVFLNSQKTKVSTGTIEEIYSKGYPKTRDKFYRLIIPLEKRITLHHILQVQSFSDDLASGSPIGTFINSSGETFLICVCQDDADHNYLSIESNLKQSIRIFSEKAFAIRCAFAFLTGQFPGGNEFFFAYKRADKKHFDHFQMQQGRKSISTLYQPIFTNPLGLPGLREATRNKWYKSGVLRALNSTELSSLHKKLYNSVELRIVILLLVQSMASSMEQLPGSISIALEMLPSIVLEDLKIDQRPIKSRALHANIIEMFKNTLDNFQSQLGHDAHSILIGKLQFFNQPTNRDKLRSPFRALDIDLLADDEIAIESRNKFLHGEIPDILKEGEKRSAARKTRDAYYCGLRLYTLISMLLLKWIGYDNFVVNQPVIHKHASGVPLKEPPYRKISTS